MPSTITPIFHCNNVISPTPTQTLPMYPLPSSWVTRDHTGSIIYPKHHPRAYTLRSTPATYHQDYLHRSPGITLNIQDWSVPVPHTHTSLYYTRTHIPNSERQKRLQSNIFIQSSNNIQGNRRCPSWSTQNNYIFFSCPSPAPPSLTSR